MSRGRSTVSMLWKKQAGYCWYCLEKMNYRRRMAKSPLDHTIDHFIPKRIIPPEISGYFYSEQTNNPNFVLACFSCNQSKGDSLPENWDGRMGPYQYLEGRGWMWIGESNGTVEQPEGERI